MADRSLDQVADETAVTDWQTVVEGFTRAQRRLMVPIESMGLPEPHFAALMLLQRATDHRLPMSKLAQELAMTSGGFTKLADRLARDGLIDRRNSAGDRRVVYATLTEQGAHTIAAAERIYRASLRQHVVDVIGRDGLGRTAQLLRELANLPGAEQPVQPVQPEQLAKTREAADGGFVAQPRDPGRPDRRRTSR